MSIRRDRDKDFADLDKLIEDIIVGAYNVEEQLWAFHKAFQGPPLIQVAFKKLVFLPDMEWVRFGDFEVSLKTA